MKSLVVLLCLLGYTLGTYNGQDRILLQDLKVLTLYGDRMTTGRRSSPVPQLKCVGGSAQNAYRPLTVQCYNRGSDGYDTQWECKTDMDNEYRFGKVEVTCEGYEYPDDPYILRGSCGLEYTLEYTKEGYQKQQSGYQSNQHHSNQHHSYHQKTHYSDGHNSNFGNLVMLGIVAVVIYVIYKSCLSGSSTTPGEAPPPYSEHDQHRQGPQAPPPPGFKPNFTSGTHSTGSQEHGQAPPPPGFKPDFTSETNTAGSEGAWSSGFGPSTHAGAGASTGGGFWTGAATGGLLGYMFGRNNGTGYGRHGYHTPNTGSSWFSGNSGGGWGSGWGSSSSSSGGWGGSSSSSGTRTASGFGGTKRR